MILKNKFYEINIKEDEVYVLNSPDNRDMIFIGIQKAIQRMIGIGLFP